MYDTFFKFNEWALKSSESVPAIRINFPPSRNDPHPYRTTCGTDFTARMEEYFPRGVLVHPIIESHVAGFVEFPVAIW